MASAKSAAAKNRLSAIIIIAVIAVVAASVAAVMVFGAQTAADTAVVHASDGSVRELPLDQAGTFSVTTEKGTNEIEVKDGQVRVVEADCPNHDCVEQGWISRAGQQIVCLPHELWIEIVPAEGSDAQDAASFDTVGS